MMWPGLPAFAMVVRQMTRRQTHAVLTVLIAAVWLGFGLFCKVLDLVPRHEEIVERILGTSYAASITRLFGVLEVLMSLWVLSGFRRRLNAIAQMLLVGVMNVLEAVLAPDLLLWGHLNALFAIAFICVVYVNEWKLGERAID